LYELPEVEHLKVHEMDDTSPSGPADEESGISTPAKPQGPIDSAIVESGETTVNATAVDAAPQKPGNQTTDIGTEESHVKAITSSSAPPASKRSKDPKTGAKVSAKAKARSESNIVIAIFGLTGTGKSNFISKLTGKDVKVGHSLQSCEWHC
jgi:hypothetical protein